MEQIQLEKEIENIKCLLVHHSDFSCLEAFKLFDIHNNGHLNLSDFKESLQRLLSYDNSKQSQD